MTPLYEKSPNIWSGESNGTKRSHDEFASDVIKVEHQESVQNSTSASVQLSSETLPPTPTQNVTHDISRGSSPLTDVGTVTPARGSPTPITPSRIKAEQGITISGTMTQPQKRKKLTLAEKEAREKDLAEKKKEKEEKATQKAKEKEAKEKETAEKKRQKEEEAATKAVEKAARQHELDEKRKEKEEKERLKKEKQEKEARKQPKLKNFFGAPITPKKAVIQTVDEKSPSKASPGVSEHKLAISQYTKMFQPFYVKANVRLASSTSQMDEETRNVKSGILDDYLSGKRTHDGKPFDPIEVFSFPSKPLKRGLLHYPVRHIMEQVYKESSGSSGGSDEANKAIKIARTKLARVPMKVIAFSQDVRPPYYGTLTFKPFALGAQNMRKVARQSMARRLPLDYDYDSEAEWQEEEGEDVDMDDDEEEPEEEDDMEGFLDDSDDAGPSRRVFGNMIEPESSGICYEDSHRQGPNVAVYEHKMELILDTQDMHMCIDPWASSYWEPEPKRMVAESTAKMAPPPAPVPTNALAALGVPPASSIKDVKLVKAEILNDVKRAILENRAMSKMGVVENLFTKFRDDATRAEVKSTLETVAERVGAGRAKAWELKAGHEIAL